MALPRAWITPFLQHLAQNGNINRSAQLAGIHAATAREKRRNDADFAAAMDNAIEDSTDVLELEARRRAVDGVQEPVVYQGQLTPVFSRDESGQVVVNPDTGLPIQEIDGFGRPVYLTVSKYSDALLAMLLKGNRRSKYGDKTEITGADGGPIRMDETKRVSRLAALFAMATERKDLS